MECQTCGKKELPNWTKQCPNCGAQLQSNEEEDE